jgi:type IV secretory pathway TrbF-like protein
VFFDHFAVGDLLWEVANVQLSGWVVTRRDLGRARNVGASEMEMKV